MLELLYSCGLRVSELINLSYHNINLNEEYIRLHGKGNKERMLPMGEVAIDYLGIYEENSRPFLLKSEQTDAYFLSHAVQKWFFYQAQLTVVQLLECLKK
jgi:integrase/recombinase XerD